MERTKMSRENRAKQFAPFDALKGLQDALKLKQYQHEKIVKGEMTEEKAKELSKILINIEKGDIVKVTYFEDDHNKEISGFVKFLAEENCLQVEKKKILLDDVVDMQRIEK